MPLPQWVARFNKRVTNRFIEPIVRRSLGFAVVEHRGRRTGSSYRTPVNVFDAQDGSVIVALTYGPKADWVRNVVTAGGTVVRRGVRRTITFAAVVGRAEAWPCIPTPVGLALRILTVHHFLRIESRPEQKASQ